MKHFLILVSIFLSPALALAQQGPSNAAIGETNLRGKWAQKVVNSSISKVPVVGKVTTDSIGYLLLNIDQEADELSITSEVCDVRIDSSVKKVRTVVPETFVEAIEKETRRARIDRDNGEISFYAPKKYSTVGVRLRNTQYETLPEKPKDPRVLDPDSDGHPGVTLRIEGLINGELYVIQRAWDVMRGTLRKSKYIDGLVEWGNEQVLLDSSSVFLGDQPPTKPHPNQRRSYFRTTRVSSQTTCGDIMRSRSKLFSR